MSRLLCLASVILGLSPGTITWGAEPAAMVRGPFGAEEWKQSAVPLRPGVPGQAPFWNAFATRFIFAPAFNFKPVAGATKYVFEIKSQRDGSVQQFESDVPHAPLSPVWTHVPVGMFTLTVTGVSARGERLGVAGRGTYHRAAPFDGPYLEPVMPYDQSGMLALDKIMEKPYVQYWLTHKTPDISYEFYRHPAKLFGSLVVGAVLHAKWRPESAARSTELARIVADYLIGLTFPQGSYLEYFPPAYSKEAQARLPHMKVNNYLVIAAAESGQAFLDLYDHTGDRKYLEAAQRIAATYLKTQLPNGTWRLYLNPLTGEPTAANLAIPTSTINYLERLRDDYGLKGADDAIARAVAWVMENPVKTFEWLAQYEDIPLANRPPYQKMSREQTCDLAIYLCRRRPQDPQAIALVEDLIRFCEDQFVTWEQIEDVLVHSGLHRPPYKITPDSPGWFSVNWLTPVVHEQYGFWMPSGRNTALMIETYWHAYRVTKKEVYRAKALSIANNFTRVQKEHNGDYPTMFTKYPMNFWINNAIYPARVMVNLHEELKRTAQ